MFDVGFSELLLLAIVALVVIGPERLPHAARVAGAWIGRIKRTVGNIQADIEREVSAQELRDRLEKEIALVREHDAMSGVSEPFEAVQQGLASLQTEARQFGQPDVAGTASTEATPLPSILPPAAATGVTLAELSAATTPPSVTTGRPAAETAMPSASAVYGSAASTAANNSADRQTTDTASTSTNSTATIDGERAPAAPAVDGEAAYREWLAAQKSPNLAQEAVKDAAKEAMSPTVEPARHE